MTVAAVLQALCDSVGDGCGVGRNETIARRLSAHDHLHDSLLILVRLLLMIKARRCGRKLKSREEVDV